MFFILCRLSGLFSLIFCRFNMVCLRVVFLAIFLRGFLWASWICGVVSDTNLVKFSVLNCFEYFFLLLFSTLFTVCNVTCCTFCSCPTVILLFFCPCYLFFLDLKFCIDVSLRGSFLSQAQSANKAVKNTFISVSAFALWNFILVLS